jgi:7-cyano-7-deazaguanine synthase
VVDIPVVVLLSGGVDSSALVSFFLNSGRRVSGIHIQYGQPASQSEQLAASQIAGYYSIPLQTIRLGFDIANVNGEFLCRNGLFVLAACSLLAPGAKRLALGIHSGAPYYDCSPRFLSDMQKVLDGQFGGAVLLEAPFLEWSKHDIFDYCQKNRVPIGLTYSCETTSGTPCGACLSCMDRRRLDEGFGDMS